MHNLCNMVKNLQWFLNCIHVSPDQTFSSLGTGPVLVDSFVLCFSLSSKEFAFIYTRFLSLVSVNAPGIRINRQGRLC